MQPYQRLDKKVQQWLFKQGWQALRPIQDQAIEPILSQQTDVLISASTASGKTEAFFLPACTALLNARENEPKEGLNNGIGILYISPLKALINDQYRRLESLADITQISLTAWHGDSLQSQKNRLRKNPSGILLITPESLEALLMRRAGWVKTAFANLSYICIDEFHAFIGMERGQHLISLLSRLEHLLERLDTSIPRIALSATLGELEAIPPILRPISKVQQSSHQPPLPCKIIQDPDNGNGFQIQVRGYIEKQPSSQESPARISDINLTKELNGGNNFENLENSLENNTEIEAPTELLVQDLYRFCRGGNHLIFANSRRRTELLSAKLSDMCEANHVPNEFFPHHSSLAKEWRETLEHRLQQENVPTTAICTMTLELGIDIGKVDSVVQITPPHSVASLRQRIGRSGRRGDPAKLRMLISEREVTAETPLPDRLHLGLIQSLAMVRLLIEKWYEPADTSQYHFSTLIHQILATISQWGGSRAEQLYRLLCQIGTFEHISTSQFKQLLTHLAKQQVITQLGNGEITLGIMGEKLTNHYSFYASFKTPEEYQIIYQGKPLGTLPIESLIVEKQYLIFAGKKWLVLSVDNDKRVILVEKAKGGLPPLFGGDGITVHDRVRQEMFSILCQRDYQILFNGQKVDYINATAKQLFAKSVENFSALGLEKNWLIEDGSTVYVFTWLGDKATNALAVLLMQYGYLASNEGGFVAVQKSLSKDEKITAHEIFTFLQSRLIQGLPNAQQLACHVPVKTIEKFDEFLPDDLLNLGYGAIAFDVETLRNWLIKKLS